MYIWWWWNECAYLIYIYNHTYHICCIHLSYGDDGRLLRLLRPTSRRQVPVCREGPEGMGRAPGIASRTMGVVTFYLQKLSFGHPIWLAVFRNVDDLPGETVHFRSLAARFPEAIRLEHQPIAGGDGSSIPKRPFRTKSGVPNLWFTLWTWLNMWIVTLSSHHLSLWFVISCYISYIP